MADDLVRMKAKTVLNNAQITTLAKQLVADEHTVVEGDEFTTSEPHAQELEGLGYAERLVVKTKLASPAA